MITIHSATSIFEAQEEYLVHQCNCVTKKAAHLAKRVFHQYPYADIYSSREYVSINAIPKELRAGNIVVSGSESERKVINLIGQIYPGRPKKNDGIDTQQMREKYFLLGLQKIFQLQPRSLAFPWRIGCGSAGGSWYVYVSLLEAYSYLYPYVDIHIYSLGKFVHVHQVFSLQDTVKQGVISDVILGTPGIMSETFSIDQYILYNIENTWIPQSEIIV